jgi:cytidylate kinase
MAVVTISRQYGSGGTEIAARVCEILGYRYLDKVLITQVAAEAGLSGKELVEFSEQRSAVRNFLDRLLRPGPHGVVRVETRARDETGSETISMEQLDEARCAKLVRSAIHAAYKQDDVVIVGRGGQDTLKNMPEVLHVRIVAPMGNRVLRIQGQEKVDVDEARRLALEHDQATARYLNQLFRVRGDNPELYHLVINTGRLSPESAAQIVVKAVEQLGIVTPTGSAAPL